MPWSGRRSRANRYSKRETADIAYWYYEWPKDLSWLIGGTAAYWAARIFNAGRLAGLTNPISAVIFVTGWILLAIGGSASKAKNRGECFRFNRPFVGLVSWGSYRKGCA